MDSIRIKNLRSIVDSGDIQLSSINILLGKNSSGKSSFLRLFPLMKETSRHELRGPILWFDENYDFGDFSNTLSRHAKGEKDMITIEFSWTLEKKAKPEALFSQAEKIQRKSKDDGQANVEIGICKHGDNTFFKRIGIKIWGNEMVFENDAPNKPVNLTLNGRKVSQGMYKWNYGSTGILPELVPHQNYSQTESLSSALTNLFGKENVRSDEMYFLSIMPFFDEDIIWEYVRTNIIKHKKNKPLKSIKESGCGYSMWRRCCV